MVNTYNQLLNLYDEDILRVNINASAYFILLFETFNDMINSCVDFFYEEESIEDGKLVIKMSKKYKKEVCQERVVNAIGKTIKNRFILNLDWLVSRDVISEAELKRVLEIRKRRNEIVHELFHVLSNGLDEKDAYMICDLMSIYLKIDNWFFQIDMGIMGNDSLSEEVLSGGHSMGAVHLMSIFKIVFCNEGEVFKQAIKDVGLEDLCT